MAYTVTENNEKSFSWSDNPDYVATALSSNDQLTQYQANDIDSNYYFVLGGNTLVFPDVNFLTFVRDSLNDLIEELTPIES